MHITNNNCAQPNRKTTLNKNTKKNKNALCLT